MLTQAGPKGIQTSHYTGAMPSLLTLAWLRTLVWLLALALPLQAQARASMLECGAAAVHQQHQQLMTEPGHEHHHAHDDGQQKEQAGKAAHQCGACAACCIGVALPSAPLALGSPLGQSVHLSTPEPASLGVVTALFERPPRPLLA